MHILKACAGIVALSSLTVVGAYATEDGQSVLAQHGRSAAVHTTPHNVKAPHSNPGHTPTNSTALRVTSNPTLAARLQSLLPPGMTLAQAAEGFKNQGQFIAALHVSQNLDIPFADLKTKMTGSNPESLGRAIQALKPNAKAQQEVRRAESEAREDLKVAKKSVTDKDDLKQDKDERVR